MSTLFTKWRERVSFSIGGGAMVFALLSLFLMPPNLMVKWVVDGSTIDEKVGRALSPLDGEQSIRKSLAEVQASSLQCHAALMEAKKQPPAIERIGEGRLESSFGKKVYLSNAESFFGGNLHVAVRDVVNGACKFHVTTEKKLIQSDGFLVPGSAIAIAAEGGLYRVVLTKAYGVESVMALQWPGCVFDVLKLSDRANIETGTIPRK